MSASWIEDQQLRAELAVASAEGDMNARRQLQAMNRREQARLRILGNADQKEYGRAEAASE